MSLESVIRTGLQPIVPVVEPNLYTGDATEYIVFNYDEIFFYAEGTAKERICLVMVHWYMPKKENPLEKKKQIAQALANSGFTYPTINNASDGDGQHYVFECEYADGDV